MSRQALLAEIYRLELLRCKTISDINRQKMSEAIADAREVLETVG